MNGTKSLIFNNTRLVIGITLGKRPRFSCQTPVKEATSKNTRMQDKQRFIYLCVVMLLAQTSSQNASCADLLAIHVNGNCCDGTVDVSDDVICANCDAGCRAGDSSCLAALATCQDSRLTVQFQTANAIEQQEQCNATYQSNIAVLAAANASATALCDALDACDVTRSDKQDEVSALKEDRKAVNKIISQYTTVQATCVNEGLICNASLPIAIESLSTCQIGEDFLLDTCVLPGLDTPTGFNTYNCIINQFGLPALTALAAATEFFGLCIDAINSGWCEFPAPPSFRKRSDRLATIQAVIQLAERKKPILTERQRCMRVKEKLQGYGIVLDNLNKARIEVAIQRFKDIRG